LHIE